MGILISDKSIEVSIIKMPLESITCKIPLVVQELDEGHFGCCTRAMRVDLDLQLSRNNASKRMKECYVGLLFLHILGTLGLKMFMVSIVRDPFLPSKPLSLLECSWLILYMKDISGTVMCNYTSALTCFLWFQSNHSLVIICHSVSSSRSLPFHCMIFYIVILYSVQNHTRIYEDAFDHMHLVSWWLFRALCCCSSIMEFIVSLVTWMQRNSGWLEKFGRICLNTMKNYQNYLIYVCMDYWYFLAKFFHGMIPMHDIFAIAVSHSGLCFHLLLLF
jgi:hypothetical protein